jgi:hypothetical protein
MTTGSAVVIKGTLRRDGTIELEHRPEMGPGPVLVRLEPLGPPGAGAFCLPDAPWLDESTPAPTDLPLLADPVLVEVVRKSELLPPPFELGDVDLRP